MQPVVHTTSGSFLAVSSFLAVTTGELTYLRALEMFVLKLLVFNLFSHSVILFHHVVTWFNHSVIDKHNKLPGQKPLHL